MRVLRICARHMHINAALQRGNAPNAAAAYMGPD